MDNPPSTPNPTRSARRVLLSSVAAVTVAASPLGIAAASATDAGPLVPSRSYVENELQLIHTQTASKAVIFETAPALALSDVEGASALGPAIATIAAPATIPASINAAIGIAAPPATVAPTTTTTAAPTTTTPAAPATTAAPAPRRAGVDPNDPAVWDRLAQCESGGNWAINTGNGYYGGLQFSASTWRSVGGTGLPHQASRETQIEMGKKLQARAGWGQWPHCTKKLGYR